MARTTEYQLDNAQRYAAENARRFGFTPREPRRLEVERLRKLSHVERNAILFGFKRDGK